MNQTVHLTAKPHAFRCAVLSPKHAKELGANQCLAMAVALSEHTANTVSYTLWITEAWRVLGWAEPTAALFWELATMVHTLYLASSISSEIPPILSCGSNSSVGSIPSSTNATERKPSPSTKELPVWVVGTFLLLHCCHGTDHWAATVAGANQQQRSSHLTERFCTAFLIRHLRKFLVLCAGPDNPDAHRAAIHLAAVPSGGSLQNSADLESLRRQHDQEHSNVGLGIKLRPDDLDRLRLVIQAVDGGLDDSLNICEILWNTLYESALHPTASMLLADVEQELQRHLVRETTLDLRRLQLSEDQPNFDQKELVYGRLKSTTVIVPPLSSPVGHPPSSAASYASEPPFVASSPSRLHDLVISDCTDTHMYILRPTEHVTIVNCVNCTIVVGAVAGLMHVTDCMHCRITTAARRVIVTGSSPDVRVFTFSPHAPLILGGSTAESDQPRSGCQFAPYNTYYEGLREDLVATGLAAAAVSENQQPPVNESNAAWPPLHSASNKWKDAHDLCQLEVPTAAAASSGGSNVPQAGADDTFKAATTVDIHHSLLVPATEFDIILVPIDNGNTIAEEGATGQGEIYSRLLIDLLHYSPFRLPAEYEKRVLSRVERMQKIQQAVQSLTVEQQVQFEEEFNADFRDWLVKTGNLRQILDLVHWEREQKEAQVVSTKH